MLESELYLILVPGGSCSLTFELYCHGYETTSESTWNWLGTQKIKGERVLTVELDLVDLEDGHVVGQVEVVPLGVDEGSPGGGLKVALLRRVPDLVGSDDDLEAAEAVSAVSSSQDVLVGYTEKYG